MGVEGGFWRRVAGATCALGVVATTAACTGGDGDVDTWGGTIDTLPGGAVRVHSPESGIWAEGETWTLVEELRLGSVTEEGPELFGQIADVAARNGEIYVLESQAHEVRVFGPDGAHLRTFGRQGAGPGELNIRFGGQVLLPPVGVWVNNSMNRRWELFSDEGEAMGSTRDAASFFGSQGVLGTDGALYLRTRASASTGAEPRDAVIRLEPGEGGLVVADTVYAPRLPEGEIVEAHMSAGGNRMTMMLPVPFVHQPSWTIDPRGHFWVDFADGYRLHAVAMDGDTIRIVSRDHTPVAVSTRERDEAAGRFAEGPLASADLDFDESRMPDVHPPFDRFLTDEVGNLWVKRTLGGDRWAWDVFDAEGRYQGAVGSEVDLARLTVHEITGEAVYGVLLDDLDVQYVVRLRIRKSGGEGGVGD